MCIAFDVDSRKEPLWNGIPGRPLQQLDPINGHVSFAYTVGTYMQM